MAVFKCKMCGGALEIQPGSTVCECQYCGTKQTLPRLDDDKKSNLYDRANHFRRSNDYDKAMSIYEQILNEDNTDAETYWSLVLCRYGIEYVEDSSSHKRIPTVNRAQYTSIFDDEDYKSALKYADGYQREVYEEEAKAINEIQKGILEISQKEEPFDVFICYKETDENGRRTQDSVLATELYHQLVQEGYKVFFSRITLEDKLGIAYEPYIFAALNSAKVMVVLGTKKEYFNAVWVKNEWSRYLSLIKQGQKKMLIPAYRDIDPYDLPEEFSHLQAQDMTRLGFMQDLIRGIKKIINTDEPKSRTKETSVLNHNNGNAEPLLKRAFLFLEDGKFEDADEYLERVLDLDPENSNAYFGKLLVECECKTKDELSKMDEVFDDSEYYQKAMRFGDEKQKGFLNECINEINTRKLNNKYEFAVSAKERNNIPSLLIAINKFNAIIDFKDSSMQIEKCKNSIYNLLINEMNLNDTNKKYIATSKLFGKISDYKDSREKQKECLDKAEECLLKEAEELQKHSAYEYAKSLMKAPNDKASLLKAIETFNSIIEYKDSKDNIEECKKKIAVIDEEERMKEVKAKKQNKIFIISTIVVIGLIISYFVINQVILIPRKYEKAMNLIENKQYEEAREILQSISNYKDARAVYDSLELKVVKKGDYINFGNYKWLVLDVKTDKILIITDKVIEERAFNTVFEFVTWETSTIRTWLNNDFFSKFNTEEKKLILSTNVINKAKGRCELELTFNNTNDKIFLLSVSEVEKYFPTEEERIAYYYGKAKAWWTRDTSCKQGLGVNSNGYLNDEWGWDVHHGPYINKEYEDGGVRPAMWISIK